METSDVETTLRSVNREIWDAIALRQDKLTGRKVSIPELQPMPEAVIESRFGTDFPVLRYLQTAIEVARQHELSDIAGKFSAVLDELRWSQNPSYNESNCAREFLDGYAYAAFSGPDAPIRCAVPRGGMFIMAPRLVYPGHNHEPREVYLVLTPGSQWRLDNGEWFDVEPGDLIYHDSWQIHSMRTGSEPLLAFAGWIEAGTRQSIGWNDQALPD